MPAEQKGCVERDWGPSSPPGVLELYFKKGLLRADGEIGAMSLCPDRSPIPQQEQGQGCCLKQARQINAQYPPSTQKEGAAWADAKMLLLILGMKRRSGKGASLQI